MLLAAAQLPLWCSRRPSLASHSQGRLPHRSLLVQALVLVPQAGASQGLRLRLLLALHPMAPLQARCSQTSLTPLLACGQSHCRYQPLSIFCPMVGVRCPAALDSRRQCLAMQQMRRGRQASVRKPRSRRRYLDSRQAVMQSRLVEVRRRSSQVWPPVSRPQECRHNLPLFLEAPQPRSRSLALGSRPARPLSSQPSHSHSLVSRRVQGLGRRRPLCLASPRRREQAQHSSHTPLALLPAGLPRAALQSGRTQPTRGGRGGSPPQVGLAFQQALWCWVQAQASALH